MENTKQQYPCIGRGFCGTVWALENNRALKREDGGPGRFVRNDCHMHRRLLNAVSASSSADAISEQRTFPAAIPQAFKLIEPTDPEFWRNNIPHFPKNYEPCLSLLSEQIPHFPQEVRERLIEQFCPSTLSDFIRSNPSDEHCLVRLYLGRRRLKPQNQSRFQRFSLRNDPLHIDQMESLGLDIEAYARAMGTLLAVICWEAGIDGNDVEFVLAPPRSSAVDAESPSPNPSSSSTQPEPQVFHSPFFGEHTIWILDFDCCCDMRLDERGVEQAVAAFFRNDPYFPRPCAKSDEEGSQMAWRKFREAFLQSSLVVLGQEKVWLAEKLVRRIEEVGWERRRLTEEGSAGGEE